MIQPAQPAVAASVDDSVLTPLAEVAQREALAPLARRLLDLRQWLADDLADFEDGILDVEAALSTRGAAVNPDGGAVAKNLRVRLAADHLLGLPGKRIRPLCVLLAARMGRRGMDADVRRTAIACELVHAATLLHDDVIDDSHERRGAPAARVLFGNSASILGGDYLLVQALRLVQSADAGVLLPDLLEVMSRIVAAEALQLERRGRFDPSREVYLQVVRGKTAALFAWGLRAGATLGGLPADARLALSDVGMHLGLAFQLVDDILDIEGDPQVTGKEALQDMREGKLTWPMILASESCTSLRGELVQIAQVGAMAYGQNRVDAVIRSVRASGALAESRAYARAEAEAACRRLNDLPHGKAREALALIVQSAVHRMQ